MVWYPHFKKDKALLERVQHQFTRLFPDLISLQYEDRLRSLGLWSLEERRNRSDLIEVFKLVHGYTPLPLGMFFTLHGHPSTRGHSWKLSKDYCRTDTRHWTFSERVINRWNQLTQADVSVSTISAFKRRLSLRRRVQMDFFIDS